MENSACLPQVTHICRIVERYTLIVEYDKPVVAKCDTNSSRFDSVAGRDYLWTLEQNLTFLINPKFLPCFLLSL